MMSAFVLNDEQRRTLISAIEATCLPNCGYDGWGIIDALKSLGALDDDQEEYVATVKAEIDEVLADPDNPISWKRAAGLWNAQFDHPYDGAYCQCWNGLSPDDRRALLIMAAKEATMARCLRPP